MWFAAGKVAPSQPDPAHLHKQKHGIKGGDSDPLQWSHETLLGVLCPAQEARHRPANVGPVEGHKMIRGLEHLSCEEKLRGLFSVEKDLRRPYYSLSIFSMGVYKKDKEGFLPRPVVIRQGGNSFKLKEG